MKKLFYIIIMSFFVGLVISCSKPQEDIYNSEYKIDSIIYDSNDNMDLKFIYEKKQIVKIVNSDGSYITLSYNSDRTVSEIVGFNANGVADGSVTKMQYENSKVKVIEAFDEGNLIEKLIFNREDKIIQSIEFFGNSMMIKNSMKKHPLMHRLLQTNQMGISQIGSVVKDDNMEFYLKFDVTCANGNIVSMKANTTMEGIDVSIYRVFEFDDKYNPFYGLPFPLFMEQGYCVNNIKSMATSISAGILPIYSESYTCVYTYNSDDFPVTVKKTSYDGSSDEQKIEASQIIYLQ